LGPAMTYKFGLLPGFILRIHPGITQRIIKSRTIGGHLRDIQIGVASPSGLFYDFLALEANAENNAIHGYRSR
jgi:hypothetical protein